MNFKVRLKYIYPLLVFSFLLLSSCSREEGKAHIYPLLPKIKKAEGERFALDAARIDSFFTSRYERGLFNGTVLFAERDRVIYKNAFGFGNFRTKDSLTVDSQFQLASVSKPITAAAVQLLHQKGLISYEDSIRKFFPDFPYENISIHLLLIHRSGLSNYMYFAEDLWEDKQMPIKNDDVINLMIEYQPQRYYLPDRKYNYINTNYALLASIVEKVSGMDFADYLKQEIFDPLEMKNTYVYSNDTVNTYPPGITGYVTRRRPVHDTYLNGVVGDKGVYSTVEDLFKFSRALFEHTLIDSSELEIAYTPAHKELYDNDNYGYGWRINKRPDGTKIIYHTGWWKGFRSYLIRDLPSEKTIVVLTNLTKSGIITTTELLDLYEIPAE